MLNEKQFEILSSELSRIAPNIPTTWGKKQGDMFDRELKKVCNIFEVTSLSEFNCIIQQFDELHRQYYLRRWYLAHLAKCDEYLFYKHPNVIPHPNEKSKDWDIQINGHLYFDIKGTRIPKEIEWKKCWCLQQCQDVYQDPKPLVEWYYCNQSMETRKGYQNRLFIVHKSDQSDQNELILRSNWRIKNIVYQNFINNVEQIPFIPTYKEGKELMCGVIFLWERNDGSLFYKIHGLNNTFIQLSEPSL